MSMKPNPAVFHDYFGIRGGGERLALTLAEAFEADLFYGYRQPESYEPAMFPRNAADLGLPAVLRRPGLRAAALAARFRLARRTARPYAVRIFSGVAAPFAAPDKADGARNIYYCHTPPRFLYDQKDFFLKNGGGSFARRLALSRFEAGYRAAVDRMDVIVANSRNIQGRISRYLGRDSVVVYPPCDTHRFHYRAPEDYYLSTARVSGLKRVGAIVDAFLRMPDRRLIVASGGEDLDRLRQRAGNAPNIEFLGWVEEATLQRLVGGAIATLYGPVDEDFGISPVESMAAGKPVIGVAEGGLKETILDGETGFLLPPGFKPDDIVAAVMRLPAERAIGMRDACERRAQEFSADRFVNAMRAIIERG
ncbi:glycosyltransferase [Fulvimarina sp. 2208YS6-2-32]|uniref:GDP-Man:Man(1)GlcNAc(2)-PP-Dol alpha-1,3-mannosyltransferase n=1 Tax=Fulvimarina uroteuthidis TaxID=3098149 RepID=A0ABU5I281_9HYPH|nr:glycosyltransferase [Fulvimarina sp. 2208YS6-2-32]MDY8108878.1 glycosyltransferase [Fulvimarina sp. 2208YS6-2-32]